MRKIKLILSAFSCVVFAFSAIALGQTAGSINGTVADPNGAVIPGATITVKGLSGQEYKATSSSNGTFNIPAVASGVYQVTIAAKGFQTFVTKEVKVDVGLPSSVSASLVVGNPDETVVVTTGGDVLQTQTATIGTTITGRQIIETPIQSRDALDLVVGLPGVNTIGTVRTSTINGLPKSAISVSMDGIDSNTSLLKSSDGFFTFVRPRIDAIDEVTVSTANPGSESSGDGAVQIKFVTRRGTNDYSGRAFWQHRNDALNANYFFNNATTPVTPRQKIKLNQYGVNFGGPIPFPNFGDGGGPFMDSGQDKRFFFVNYEEYRIPESSPTRQRTILDTGAQAGQFEYNDAGTIRSVNLFNLADGLGFPNTPDPTVAALLSSIRSSTGTTGSIAPIVSATTGAVVDFNRERFNFQNLSNSVRKFLTVRMDFNLTKNHSLEGVLNKQEFRGDYDLLNNLDPSFPGFTNGGTQNSDRWLFSTALRSTLGQNAVNELRFGKLWGQSGFVLVGGKDFFNETMGGRNLTINVPGFGTAITNPAPRLGSQIRQEPTFDITDNFTFLKGNHSMTFGGQYKKIRLIDDNQPQIIPTIGFGVASTDPILTEMFTLANFPGSSAPQRADAAALYALLTGRVSTYTETAFLGADGQYLPSGPQLREISQKTYGVYAQDVWRIKPNLTLTFGLRWQPQEGYALESQNFARLTDFNMVYDVSGTGNIFSPGTTTGVVPTATGTVAGEKAFATDFNNFAPSLGIVWSPDIGPNRALRFLFGESGKSVFRGGFSRAFIREGTNLANGVLGNNPGGSISTSRSTALGNLIGVGTLLRDTNNPNLTPAPFDPTPVFPRDLTSADSAFAFSPDLKTGYVDSFSVGFQRELDSNTVIEFRYVGNRGKDMFRLYNTNEINTIENGFAGEFLLAQANLYANMAAGRGATFAHFAGTGTSPLPIFQSYYTGNANSGTYTSTQYTNAANVASLSVHNPNVVGLAASLNTDAGRRANGITANRPANFINNCPTTVGFCYIMNNAEISTYDSGVIEVRRRLTNGLRFQASYVFGKAFTNAFAGATTAGGFAAFAAGAADQNNNSAVTLRNEALDKSYAQIDIRHAFKVDATYDLPFGTGRQFFSNANKLTNALVGGWSILPSLRWQSGSPILLENVQLVGMTVKELQKAVRVNKGAAVTWLPDDIIANTIAAHNVSVTTSTGYSTQFGVPTGRFIAPAGFGNCQARYAGECGFRKLVIYGPGFFKLDASVGKKIFFDEKRSVELRATYFDVLNRTNFRVGGWGGNFTNLTAANMTAGNFGQLVTGTAFQDPFGSNDPGGRIIDLMLRINF